jgi:hypothetical protein
MRALSLPLLMITSLGKVGGEVKFAKFKLVSIGHSYLLKSINSTSYHFGDVIITQP